MFSIHVERTINQPIEKVFAILSDHANYAQFKAIEQSNLLVKGSDEPNGLGAVREIISGGSNLHEEIVAYEPPYKLGYKVVKSKPLPYDHQLGEITLKDEGGKTHVTWVSSEGARRTTKIYHMHHPSKGVEIILTKDKLQIGNWYRLKKIETIDIDN